MLEAVPANGRATASLVLAGFCPFGIPVLLRIRELLIVLRLECRVKEEGLSRLCIINQTYVYGGVHR